jgi:multidrug transporter EmrE-like cation transporter
MNTRLIAIVSVVLSVLAQFCLKAGVSSREVKAAFAHPLGIRAVVAVLSNAFVLGGFLLYGLGAVVWLGVLSRWEVSKAYPLVGLGFALTAVAGWMGGEHVTLNRAIGVALICAGVFLVSGS